MDTQQQQPIWLTVTVISDTHGSHDIPWSWPAQLPGGDLILHAGDLSDIGKKSQIEDFCEWYDGLAQYKHKIFICGNHDLGFEKKPKEFQQLIQNYKNITYLQDNSTVLTFGSTNSESVKVKIYGSPWQPTFFNWAFNLDRNSEALKKKWDLIPDDVDILVTHSPPNGILDYNLNCPNQHLGCELLTQKVFGGCSSSSSTSPHPKLHIFGHLHEGRGYKMEKGIHFFNAAVLDSTYFSGYPPQTFKWNPKTNEIVITHQ